LFLIRYIEGITKQLGNSANKKGKLNTDLKKPTEISLSSLTGENNITPRLNILKAKSIQICQTVEVMNGGIH